MPSEELSDRLLSEAGSVLFVKENKKSAFLSQFAIVQLIDGRIQMICAEIYRVSHTSRLSRGEDTDLE
jgi:hypothetical protein